MDMLSIGGEYRSAADEPADNRQGGFKDGQAERNHRNSNGNNRRSFLRTLKSQCAQHESDKQASTIAQKDGRGIEVVAQKSEHGPCQRKGQEGNERFVAQ